jgi:hypothetical protein
MAKYLGIHCTTSKSIQRIELNQLIVWRLGAHRLSERWSSSGLDAPKLFAVGGGTAAGKLTLSADLPVLSSLLDDQQRSI